MKSETMQAASRCTEQRVAGAFEWITDYRKRNKSTLREARLAWEAYKKVFDPNAENQALTR